MVFNIYFCSKFPNIPANSKCFKHKRYNMFLLVPDADVEEFCFFNAEFKIPYQ